MVLPVPVIDAHVHLWRLADRPQPWIDPATMQAIDRDFTVADLEAAIDGTQVERVVLVQVLNREDETADYLRLAASTPLIAGVVGWTDLASDRVADRIDGLCGVRHQAQAEPDPVAWIGRPEVARGMRVLGERGLVCELMMAAHQLDATEKVVASCNETRFVLNHAGKVPLAQGWDSEACRRWAASITRLARLDNLVCKLSGLTTMAAPGWVPADLTPAVDHLLGTFGPGRLIFGSDWPNSLRAGGYRRTVQAVLCNLGQLSEHERDAVFAGNAERTYGLREAATA